MQLPLQISFRHMEHTPGIEATIREKAAALDTFAADDVAPLASQPSGVDVERIQDLVEMGLMARGHYRVARRYIIYRAEHALCIGCIGTTSSTMSSTAYEPAA